MAGTVSVDALLADAVTKLDSLTKRMDALEVGEKKIIKGDDDDKKSQRDDAGAKTAADDDDDDRRKDDGITAPKTRIKDDDGDKKKDDASVTKAKVTGDSKKSDDGELEIKHGKEKDDSSKKSDAKKADAKKADAKKADDDDDKKSDDDDDDKKSDDDDDDKKDDSARADEVGVLRRQIADQKAMIDRLNAMMKPRSDEEHAAFADAQARADAVFNGFGQRAPRPLEGEALLDYRKRLATKLKTHSTAWKSVKLSQLPDQAFDVAEGQIYTDAESAAANPVDLGAGEMRMVTKRDPNTNQVTNVFYGKESFVKQMGRPGRRVASFRTLQSI